MGFPADISFEFVDIYSFDGKVRFYILQVLVLIQSDLYTTSTSAGTLHSVLIQLYLDYMSCTRHFLNQDIVRVLRQTA